MKFIGREKELQQLREIYGSDSFELVLLVGHRRVGKTKLLYESIKNVKTKVLHFAAAKVSYSQNFSDLCEYVSVALGGMPFNFGNIESLMNYVFVESDKQNLTFIIDEFSYLVKENRDFLGLFARAIERHHGHSKLKIIVSGPLLDIMRELDEEEEVLHGRFTAKITIHPFSYLEVRKIFHLYSNEEIIETYAYFGGVPFYLSQINPHSSPQSELKRLLLCPDSFLESEITSTLSQEISKAADANTILFSIATGANKYKDIATRLGKSDAAGINYTLEKLIKMDLVMKLAPIDAKKDTRKTLYVIKDNLFAFYYRYVFLHQKERETMGEDLYYERVFKEKIDRDYLPKVFESVRMSFIQTANKKRNV